MEFSKVAPGFYRGSRPESAGDLYRIKDELGISTIISLETGFGRFFDHLTGKSFDEEKVWQNGSFQGKLLRFPLSNFTPPNYSEMGAILSAIEQHSQIGDGVYLHCYAGVDRTGFMVAAWRVLYEGVHPEIAWREAVAKGMHARYWWWKADFLANTATL